MGRKLYHFMLSTFELRSLRLCQSVPEHPDLDVSINSNRIAVNGSIPRIFFPISTECFSAYLFHGEKNSRSALLPVLSLLCLLIGNKVHDISVQAQCYQNLQLNPPGCR